MRKLIYTFLISLLLVGSAFGFEIERAMNYAGSGQLVLPAGSVTTPSVVSDDADSGFYFGSKGFNWGVDGVKKFGVSSAGEIYGASTSESNISLLSSPYFTIANGNSLTIRSLSTSFAGGEVEVQIGDQTRTNTSGSHVGLKINGIYNQASGTAANTDLLINRTETAVGSGAQLLIDAQVGGASKFKVDNKGNISITSPDAAAVAPTRATKHFEHVRTLAADTDNACGTEDDCLTLPIPTSTGRCEIWYGTLYMLAILANDGTATVITDSDAAGTGIEYNAAIASCAGMCLHDGGANSIIFNDTASSADVHVSCVYD